MGMQRKKQSRQKRKLRIRKKISGTSIQPRLSVFRSAKHIYAQVINDENGVTLVSASTYEKEFKSQDKFESKIDAANFIGKLVGQRAIDKGIKKVVFDRNGFIYHGRVKAVSEGAREAGLEF